MGSDYNYIKIDFWQNGIPYYKVECDQAIALRYDDLIDENCSYGKQVSMNNAVEARELTSPYGTMHYGVGDDDYFINFDYGVLPDGRIALHTTVNSESGGYIGMGHYSIELPSNAGDMAQLLLNEALDTLIDVGVKNQGWGKTGYQFPRDVRATAMRITPAQVEEPTLTHQQISHLAYALAVKEAFDNDASLNDARFPEAIQEYERFLHQWNEEPDSHASIAMQSDIHGVWRGEVT